MNGGRNKAQPNYLYKMWSQTNEQEFYRFNRFNQSNLERQAPIIPFSFALAIICFFLSFCVFSCGGQKIGSVSGINLVTGTDLKSHDMITGNETRGEKIPASIWAIFAFGAAIVGLGGFLIKEKRENLIGTGAGAIGFISLLILQFAINSSFKEKGQGQIDVSFQFGYWLALLALGIAGLLSFLRMRKINTVVINDLPQLNTSKENDVNPASPYIQQQFSKSISPQLSSFKLDIGKWLSKNKKLVIYCSLGILSIFILFIILTKTIWSIEHKAQKYLDSGMFEQARMVLDGEIQKNRDNAMHIFSLVNIIYRQIILLMHLNHLKEQLE